MRLPEGLSFKDIVDHAFIMNETLEEQILGLNQIHFIFLGIGVILSVTIFCAGQVYERSTLVERIHKLDLEKLKQKTEAKL